jgi:deoxyribodipyrimidine photo-lyase
MGAAMRRGADVLGPHQHVGEAAARARLEAFVGQKIDLYAAHRDFPAEDVTSGLSENLTYGEISARTCWLAGLRAREAGRPGAEKFLMELCWREFAYHLIHHTPHIVEEAWRPEWQGFPWGAAAPENWIRARTGVPAARPCRRWGWGAPAPPPGSAPRASSRGREKTRTGPGSYTEPPQRTETA